MSTVLADIMMHVVAPQPRARLKHQQRDLLDRAFGAVGMDSGHRSRMAGIDRAQESISLGPAQLADDDPVGAHPQAGGKQANRR